MPNDNDHNKIQRQLREGESEIDRIARETAEANARRDEEYLAKRIAALRPDINAALRTKTFDMAGRAAGADPPLNRVQAQLAHLASQSWDMPTHHFVSPEVAADLERDAAPRPRTLDLVFAGTPDARVFVEAEIDGKSVRVGGWVNRPDGRVALRMLLFGSAGAVAPLFTIEAKPVDPEALAKLRAALENEMHGPQNAHRVLLVAPSDLEMRVEPYAPDSGLALIVAERQRQIEAGHTAEWDDGMNAGVGGEDRLARMAACYAAPLPIYEYENSEEGHAFKHVYTDEFGDTVGRHSTMMVDAIERLTKAGALCAAEIDRLTGAIERERPGREAMAEWAAQPPEAKAAAVRELRDAILAPSAPRGFPKVPHSAATRSHFLGAADSVQFWLNNEWANVRPDNIQKGDIVRAGWPTGEWSAPVVVTSGLEWQADGVVFDARLTEPAPQKS